MEEFTNCWWSNSWATQKQIFQTRISVIIEHEPSQTNSVSQVQIRHIFVKATSQFITLTSYNFEASIQMLHKINLHHFQLDIWPYLHLHKNLPMLTNALIYIIKFFKSRCLHYKELTCHYLLMARLTWIYLCRQP